MPWLGQFLWTNLGSVFPQWRCFGFIIKDEKRTWSLWGIYSKHPRCFGSLRTRLSSTAGGLEQLANGQSLQPCQQRNNWRASSQECWKTPASIRQIPTPIQVFLGNAVEDYVGEKGLPIFSSGYMFSTRGQDLRLSCRTFLRDTDAFPTFCSVVFIFIHIHIICSLGSFLDLVTQLSCPGSIIFHPWILKILLCQLTWHT